MVIKHHEKESMEILKNNFVIVTIFMFVHCIYSVCVYKRGYIYEQFLADFLMMAIVLESWLANVYLVCIIITYSVQTQGT